MPELPEVETVRRGLAPAMVGARIDRVEQRRPDLRFPVSGALRRAPARAGRIVVARPRAKYLARRSRRRRRAGHASRHVRPLPVARTGRAASRARRLPPRGGRRCRAHDHVVFHLSTGARVTYNDPRRFGFMDARPAGRPGRPSAVSRPSASSRSATRSTARCSPGSSPARRRRSRRRCSTSADRRPRQHLCLRGAVPGRPVAAADGRHARDASRTARRGRAPARGGHPGGSRGCNRGRRLDAARLRPDRRLARLFPARLPRSMTARASPARRRAAAGVVRRIVQSGRSTFYCGVCQR